MWIAAPARGIESSGSLQQLSAPYGATTLAAAGVLGLAALVVACGVAVGVRRTQAAGRLDVFHPLIFPTAYVGIACLAPTAWIWLGGGDLGYIQARYMSERTPLMMALSAIGFVLGSMVPFARRHAAQIRDDPKFFGIAGRLLLLLPLILAFRDVLGRAVQSRGQGQDVFTISDSINAAGLIVAPAAVGMILVSRYKRNLRLLGASDTIMIGLLISMLGLNGRRGASIAIVLIILVMVTRRSGTTKYAALGLAGAALFSIAVVVYRTLVAGGSTALSLIAMPLRDLGSVAFTTGATDLALREGGHFGGSTILAGLLRQLPSPIANRLFGPPLDTGAQVFRHITGRTSGSQGYGFSLPAEGVLNFGLIGPFFTSLVAGALLAWLYCLFDVRSSRAIELLYPIAVGTLPFAWRSDTLGAVKGVLYPAVIFWMAIAFSRVVSTRDLKALLAHR